MRIVYFGDVVGRSGREAVLAFLPTMRAKLQPDFVILNAENAAAGFGATPKICRDFYGAGIDVIVLGNHAWDQKEIIPYIQGEPRLLRPLNYPKGTAGRGAHVFETSSGYKILVVQLMGRLFMDSLDDPFQAIEGVLSQYPQPSSVNAIFVDVHTEANSEKYALGYYLDGRVSAVVGTHTHVPTSDERILPKGTGYLTDVGMCGDYDSVIGMKTSIAIQRFLKRPPLERLAPAEGKGTVCCVCIDINPSTGRCTSIRQVIVGPHLANKGLEG